MIKVLVFPCGSEVALEINRSIRYSTHVQLIGANSVDDHGKYVFENYIGGLPFIDSNEIIPRLKEIVEEYQIDAIYPAMDKVITILKSHEKELGCRIISSSLETTEICLSKEKTYNLLKNYILVPKVYSKLDDVKHYPVFIKPKIGYGSRGVFLAKNFEKANDFLKSSLGLNTELIITEYLPGEEYTIDCFSNRKGQLLFVGARERNRIMNGISVNTFPVEENESELKIIAAKINSVLQLRGAWFFQVKKNIKGEFVLLEVASRLGGSSALFRNKGINFALLSIFDAFDFEVELNTNDYKIELDRAFSNRYKTNIEYEEVYVDFDDCLIIRGKVNEILVSFLYQAINNGKILFLLTKHELDINETLKKYRLQSLFDKIIHIEKSDLKYRYIKNPKSIFIDDSFVERKAVKENKNIPVFSPDMVECLLSY